MGVDDSAGAEGDWCLTHDGCAAGHFCLKRGCDSYEGWQVSSVREQWMCLIPWDGQCYHCNLYASYLGTDSQLSAVYMPHSKGQTVSSVQSSSLVPRGGQCSQCNLGA